MWRVSTIIAVTCIATSMLLLILCMYREIVTAVQETESDGNQCDSRVLNDTPKGATHRCVRACTLCVIKMMHVAMCCNLMQIPL